MLSRPSMFMSQPSLPGSGGNVCFPRAEKQLPRKASHTPEQGDCPWVVSNPQLYTAYISHEDPSEARLLRGQGWTGCCRLSRHMEDARH